MTDQELIAGLRKLAVAMTEAGYTVWRGVRPADVDDAAERLELLTDAQRLRELVGTQAAELTRLRNVADLQESIINERDAELNRLLSTQTAELIRLRNDQATYMKNSTALINELDQTKRAVTFALSHLQTI
jgi:hypothetical protein